MDKFRMRFSKTGRAVYISHLDLMHTFQRAFSRAGYELKYSEGFNPHPLISIAMPLSVGTSSACELMDFRLKNDAVYNKEQLKAMAFQLTGALPEGIKVEKVYEPVRKITDLKWLQAEGMFSFDVPAEMEKLRAFYGQKEIPVTKKTKRGTAVINLPDGIRSLSLESEDGRNVTVRAVLSAQEPVLNPELLVEALRQLQPELVPDCYVFSRREILDAKMNVFD